MRKLLVLAILGLTSLFADYKLVLTDVDGNQTEQCVKSYSFSNNLESIARQKGVANDVYSTEETLTNKVYLGKPVYRRVIPLSDFVVNKGDTVYKLSDEISKNLEDVVYFDFMTMLNNITVNSATTRYETGSSGYQMILAFYNNKKNKAQVQINHSFSSPWRFSKFKFILEYTKTTDIANTSPNRFKSYLIYSLSSSLNDTVIVKDMKNLGLQLLENYTYDSSTDSCTQN